MKELQKAPAQDQHPGPEPVPEVDRKIDLEERIAAAAAACFFGAPTAFLIWLFVIAAEEFVQVGLPHHYTFLTIWALLTLCGFLFPRSTAEMFGNLWARLLLGIVIMLVLLYVVMGTP